MGITKAVIPAAGKGRRLFPFTEVLPKEMLPIGGSGNFKPFIHHVAEEAIESELTNLIIITRPEKYSIQQYFDRMKIDGIVYVNQREQKGLGHAILQAQDLITEPFAVLLGDDYIDCSVPATKQLMDCYESLNQRYEDAALLGVERLPPEKMTEKGMVVVGKHDGIMTVSDLIEKPDLESASYSNYAACGRYILPPKIFEILKGTPPGRNGEIQLTDAIKALIKLDSPVFAYEIKGMRWDIGTPENYNAALKYALSEN